MTRILCVRIADTSSPARVELKLLGYKYVRNGLEIIRPMSAPRARLELACHFKPPKQGGRLVK